MYDILYDVAEETKVQYVGFITEESRYDFSIIFTRHFFGKTLISCIQSGFSVLLEKTDLDDVEFIQHSFKLRSLQEAKDVCSFLRNQVPPLLSMEQY